MTPKEMQDRIVSAMAATYPSDLSPSDFAAVVGGMIVGYGVLLHKKGMPEIVDMALESLAEARANIKD